MKEATIVVPSSRKQVAWQSFKDPVNIVCEAPTLICGVPAEWVEGFVPVLDSIDPIGERDTLGNVVVAEVAQRYSMFSVVADGEDNGLDDFQVGTDLEDRPDTSDHEVVWAGATR